MSARPGLDLDALVPLHVRKFEPYIPSRPDDELKKLYHCDRLYRLHNNENPLGPPPAARAVIAGFEPARGSLYPSGDSFHHLSHGESFRAILEDRTRHRGRIRPGLYLLDEPESALSFTSSLHALATLVDLLAEPGVQIVMATHSPMLSALPGATILQLSDAGIEPRAWEDLDLVVNERYFLADPQRFLRHLS